MIIGKLARVSGGLNVDTVVISGTFPDQVIYPYDQVGPNLFAITAPASLPAGTPQSAAGTCVRWSPNKNYVALTHQTSPYLTVYKKVLGKLVKIANPASLPPNDGFSVAWAPASDYLAIAINSTSPYITIYSLVADVLTSVAVPTITATMNSMAWSASGHLVVGKAVASAPNLLGWSVSGVTYTAMTVNTDPAIALRAMDWSSDSVYLAACSSTSPYIALYSRAANALTKLTNPGTLPAGQGRAIKFSPDTNYLLVGHRTTPYFTLYSRSGTTFTKLTNPGTLPTDDIVAVSWLPDNSGFFVCEDTKIHAYTVSGSTITFVRTITPGYTFIRGMDE